MLSSPIEKIPSQTPPDAPCIEPLPPQPCPLLPAALLPVPTAAAGALLTLHPPRDWHAAAPVEAAAPGCVRQHRAGLHAAPARAAAALPWRLPPRCKPMNALVSPGGLKIAYIYVWYLICCNKLFQALQFGECRLQGLCVVGCLAAVQHLGKHRFVMLLGCGGRYFLNVPAACV